MARILQAFHSNPALGGFGNESGISIKEGDCDAFAQIVKELVDNAVDACRQDSEQIRRVRVDFSQVSPTVLRVTVTDNGCGMSCIQDCVEAFRSHKRNSSNQTKTAGRYGIGLTLCLLHAQRLVPNSTASITSATKTSNCFQQADYVVDTEVDCIKCIHEEEIPKSRPDESGTSVSVLVPVRLLFLLLILLLILLWF
jgi:DNA topoisomerase VI subunit B